MLQRFEQTPDGDKMRPELQHQFMHIALPGYVLMVTDAPEEMGFLYNREITII